MLRAFPRLAGLLIAIWLLSSCGALSNKQKTAATEAMKALRKVAAATQVGVNYQQYGILVIDAQAQVNEALAILPEGELKKEMNLAMEAYADAQDAWGAKIRSGAGELHTKYGPGERLIPKYSLPTSQGFTPSLGDRTDAETAMQTIWAVARTHVDNASKLLEQ